MARRISWTNNSSGHTGTYIYRAETLDPQDLPEPVATVDPVAQGAAAEWIDNSGEYGCFAVQDFDGQGVGTLSAEVCVTDPFAGVSVGDEAGGGIYAGEILYADGRKFHIIFSKQSGESGEMQWGNRGVATGSTDFDDGLANQQNILNNNDNGDSFPFYHCRDYIDDAGNADYYVPSRNELDLANTLVGMGHPEFSTDLTGLRWSSTEVDAENVRYMRFSDGTWFSGVKDWTGGVTRPIRRIPA